MVYTNLCRIIIDRGCAVKLAYLPESYYDCIKCAIRPCWYMVLICVVYF